MRINCCFAKMMGFRRDQPILHAAKQHPSLRHHLGVFPHRSQQFLKLE
jgi:hypothetical protein